MSIRETNKFCGLCRREMEFSADGTENYELVGTYHCRHCGNEERGRYNEMAFFHLGMEHYEMVSVSLQELLLEKAQEKG